MKETTRTSPREEMIAQQQQNTTRACPIKNPRYRKRMTTVQCSRSNNQSQANARNKNSNSSRKSSSSRIIILKSHVSTDQVRPTPCVLHRRKHLSPTILRRWPIISKLESTTDTSHRSSINTTKSNRTASHHQRMQRQKFATCSVVHLFLLVQLLLFVAVDNSSNIFLSNVIVVVTASWIDPATPMDARTTSAYNLRAPPKPKPQQQEETTTKTKSINQTKVPTSAPTTMTVPPTTSPTTSPSMYPTYDPQSNVYELVFSDEFNTPNREFYDGADPRWTAMDKNDYTNDALHYYSPNNVRTNENGELVITSQAADTDVVGFDDVKLQRTRIRKHFKSAMLQSWNKFCITGGILEAKVTLPGKHDVGGLWPAFWLLGNLARHTYVGSSEHIWPFAATNCTNIKMSRQQKISGCDKVSHYGLESYLGRGSPEIDIFEVQPGSIKANNGPFLKSPVGQPFMSASYQVAPGRSTNRPGSGEWPGPGQWYDGLMGGANASLNILFYGTYNHFRDDVNPALEDYWSDAISYNRQLDNSHFDRSHIYRLEWDVPSNTTHGYLRWFLDGELVYSIDGKGIADSSNGAEISSEPSYIILNTAISKQWGFPIQCPTNCPCKVYNCNSKRWQDLCGFSMGFCKMMQSEPEYKIDWVRAYQNPKDPKQKVGCSTPERPTRKFILAHEKVYKTETDEHPLKGVSTGLGSCDPNAVGLIQQACGGSGHGRCTPGHVCECDQGWTGPHCLANVAYDDIEYDVADRIVDVGFIPPRVAPFTLWGSLGCMMILLFVGMFYRRRLAIWEPVPDVSEEYLMAARKYHYFHRRGMSV